MRATPARQPFTLFSQLVAVLLLLSTIPHCRAVLAAPAGAPSNAGATDPVVFRLASDVMPTGGIQLANGIIVLPGDWNTIVLASIARPEMANARAATCSGTLVGPNVVLMAAHCVDSPLLAKPRRSVLELDGGRLDLVCEIHPDYLGRDPRVMQPRGSEDYALCLIEAGAHMPPSLAGLNFENVDVTAQLVPGDRVLMTGYGCAELNVVGGQLVPTRSDTTLRIGDGEIEEPASGVAPVPAYVTIRSANGRQAALCPGDSGGPLMSGVTSGAQNGRRRVRGVNSMVDSALRGDGGYDIISSIAATGTPQFRTWSRNWLARNATHAPLICGVNRQPGAAPCRD